MVIAIEEANLVIDGNNGGCIDFERVSGGRKWYKDPKLRVNVVLDGSNIVHGGPDCDDVNGFRLVGAINRYPDRDYNVLPRIKRGTLHYMSGNFIDKDSGMKIPKAPGYDALMRMTKGPQPILITYDKDDDLAIIELATDPDIDAWIVTKDRFMDEREKYAQEYDWDDIDTRLWGVTKKSEKIYHVNEDWHVEGANFFHRGLSRAQKFSIREDPFYKLRNEVENIQRSAQRIEKLYEELSETQIEKSHEICKFLPHIRSHAVKLKSAIPNPILPDEKKLNGLLKVDLVTICQSLNIPKSGNKADLVRRILQSQKEA